MCTVYFIENTTIFIIAIDIFFGIICYIGNSYQRAVNVRFV